MVEMKTPAEIQAMRASGRVVAQILAAVQDQAKAGTRLTELDGWPATCSRRPGPPRRS